MPFVETRERGSHTHSGHDSGLSRGLLAERSCTPPPSSPLQERSAAPASCKPSSSSLRQAPRFRRDFVEILP